MATASTRARLQSQHELSPHCEQAAINPAGTRLVSSCFCNQHAPVIHELPALRARATNIRIDSDSHGCMHYYTGACFTSDTTLLMCFPFINEIRHVCLDGTLLGTLTGSSQIKNGLSIATTGFSLGLNRFYAVAVDNEGKLSSSVTTTSRINAAPTIAAFTSNPTSGVLRDQIFALTMSGVADTDGTVKKVELFYDLNGNGTFEAGTDRALGNAKQSGSTWTYSLKNKRLPLGTVTIFARAIDNDGGLSTVSSLQLTLR